MKNKTFLTSVAVVAGLALFISACNHSDDSDASGLVDSGTQAATSTQPASATATTAAAPASSAQLNFLVGTILPESGDLAFLGPPMVRAADLAAQEINAANLGINITLNKADSASQPDVAGNVANTHIARGVNAILGAAASGISLSIIDRVVAQNIVMISPSNTSPTFSTYDDNGYYFRTAPSDVLQAQLVGGLVTADGNSNTVILNRADDYGRQLAAGTRQALEDSGASATVIEYDHQASSFEAEAQQALAANPDSIVLIAFAEGAQVLSALLNNNLGPQDVDIYITDGLASADLGERVNPSNPGVIAGITSTAPSAVPSSGEATFVSRFRAFAPDVEDLIFSSATYDALVILALAAMIAGSTNPTDYVTEINGVTRGGTKCTLFAACAELVNNGQDIDYDGASGTLEFGPNGEPTTGIYDVSEYQSDGTPMTIRQVTL